jgi:hypothetical protein
MRANIITAYTFAGLLWLAGATDDTIVIGPGSDAVSADAWNDVLSSPTNSTISKFSGFDTSKSYPSSKQSGWELSIGVKSNVNGADGNITASVMSISRPGSNNTVDSSWHFCLYVFSVKPSSSSNYLPGQNNSCSNLVEPQCIEDLKKLAVSNSSQDGCGAYSTTPSCLKNFEQQSAKALSVSGKSCVHHLS